MELTLFRLEKTTHATIGKIYDGDIHLCDTLEDRDRGLRQDWEVATILAKKVYGETAIPLGRYEIEITYSNRFKRYLPQLLNVKGFEGIRIHPGNKAEDTHGCVLPGVRSPLPDEMMVLNSRVTFNRLYKIIGEALLNEKVYITIE